MKVSTLGAFLALNLLFGAAIAQNCGLRHVIVQKLIFEGYKAQAGAWPWHGAMFQRLKAGQTTYTCGVTILTEQFVITAAHCTIDLQDQRQPTPAERVYVKVGLTDLDSPERHVQQHNVDRIIRHQDYEEDTFENDIALMKLFTEITFNDYVQPICLWQGSPNLQNVVAQIGHVVGWGLEKGYGLPKQLNEATMPILSRKECVGIDATYCTKFYFESKTFCAGHRNGTTASPGDSGSGLFLRQGNGWVLRGIVSNTKIDPNSITIDSKSFVVFTDTSHYHGWIKAYVPDVYTDPRISVISEDFNWWLFAAVLVMFVVFLFTLIHYICSKGRDDPETV